MWIINSDRDLMVLYYEPEEQELYTALNVREWKTKEIVLYLDGHMLADYDNPIEAVREMEKIAAAYESGQEEYQVKDYELSESDRELARHLTAKYREVFMPDDDTILKGWCTGV